MPNSAPWFAQMKPSRELSEGSAAIEAVTIIGRLDLLGRLANPLVLHHPALGILLWLEVFDFRGGLGFGWFFHFCGSFRLSFDHLIFDPAVPPSRTEKSGPPFGFFFGLRSFTLTAGLALAVVRFFMATFWHNPLLYASLCFGVNWPIRKRRADDKCGSFMRDAERRYALRGHCNLLRVVSRRYAKSNRLAPSSSVFLCFQIADFDLLFLAARFPTFLCRGHIHLLLLVSLRKRERNSSDRWPAS